MRFSLQCHQRAAAANPIQQWEVVLDNEHVMFVGNYRQCEDWLDLHELTSGCAVSETNSCLARNCSPSTEKRRGAATIFRKATSWLFDFCRSESGNSGAAEMILIFVTMAALHSMIAAVFLVGRVAMSPTQEKRNMQLQQSYHLPFRNGFTTQSSQAPMDIVCDDAQ